MTEPSPNETQPSLPQRILSALIGGAGIDAISAREALPPKRVESIVREELGRRWIAPLADFAKLQVARLENLSLMMLDRIQKGEIEAVDRALKIFDRLDRYHGFSRANPAVEPFGDEERERLLDKLNTVAARLDAETPEE